MDHTITAAVAFRYGACNDHTMELLERMFPDDAPLCEFEKPIHLTTILKLSGIEDAIWTLRTLDGHEREMRLFAGDCAEHVQEIYESGNQWKDSIRDVIKTARRLAIGEASNDDVVDAWDAAWEAVFSAEEQWEMDAAKSSAYALRDTAFDAARDSAWYARRAAGDTEQEFQSELFIRYFGGDK